jgi:hypothetical protein
MYNVVTSRTYAYEGNIVEEIPIKYLVVLYWYVLIFCQSVLAVSIKL